MYSRSLVKVRRTIANCCLRGDSEAKVQQVWCVAANRGHLKHGKMDSEEDKWIEVVNCNILEMSGNFRRLIH